MLLATEERQPLPVAEAKSGDADAWDVLFRRYQLPLYVYVYELVRNEQTSLDLIQETFASAVRHVRGLRQDEKFGAWLFGIAHQKCLQYWRRHGREDAVIDERAELDAPDMRPDPSEQLAREEQQAQFLRSLANLPPHHRSVLLLHYLEGFSLEEIARIAAVPVGTVKSRLFHAKRMLRQSLEKES